MHSILSTGKRLTECVHPRGARVCTGCTGTVQSTTLWGWRGPSGWCTFGVHNMETPEQSDAARLCALGLHPVWLAAPAQGVKGSGKAPLGGPGWNAHPWAPDAPRQPFPGANLGIQTGYVEGAPVQVVVLDCDSPQALEWADAHVPPTPVRTVTGKGEHRYYRRPHGEPGTVGGRVKLSLPDGTKLDVDVKGDGGQCVAAPSVHYSGHRYTEASPWTAELLAAMPTWDPAWVGGRGGRTQRAVRHDSDTLTRPGMTQASIRARVKWILSHTRDFGQGMDAARVREALATTVDGSGPLATTGARGSTVRDVTWVLSRQCPEATADQLVEYLTPAIQAMGDGWDTDRDWGLPGVFLKVETARRKLADDDATRLATMTPTLAVAPSPPAVDSDAEPPPPDMSKVLVVVHPRADVAWVRKPDHTYQEGWSKSSAYQYRDHERGLRWAAELGLADWWRQTPKGPVPKRPEEFFAQYSTPLEPSKHRLSLLASANTYDLDTGTFTEAVAPARADIVPERDPDLEAWLQVFAGDEYPRLVDWMATVTFLDRPTPILAIIGWPGCGKGLFIEGLSRLWHHGRAPNFASIVGNFQEALAKSPLLIADEYLPSEGPNGSDIFEFLRELVTNRTHTVNRKNLPVTQVEGCVRLVYASNKSDGLNFKNANTAAKAALAERFVYLTPPEAAARHLSGVSQRTKDRWAAQGIASHCLWLRDNHRVAYQGRLLVQGNGAELIDSASNSRGPTGHLCEALVRFLLDPQVVTNNTRDHFHLEDGALWVATRAFEDRAAWEALVPSLDGKRYSTSQLGTALSMLSTESKRKRYTGAKTKRPVQAIMHKVDLAQVFAFAQRTGQGDVDIMRATLGGVAHIAQAMQPPPPAPEPSPAPLFQAIAQVMQSTTIEHKAPTPMKTTPDFVHSPSMTTTDVAAALSAAHDASRTAAKAVAKAHSKRATAADKAAAQAAKAADRAALKAARDAARRPKWMAPAPPVAADYATPTEGHPMVAALAAQAPATPTAVRALCQPFLVVAQPSLNTKGAKEGGGPAMTYGRLVLAQRAYIRELQRGTDPAKCAQAALDAYQDRPNWDAMNAPVGGGAR